MWIVFSSSCFVQWCLSYTWRVVSLSGQVEADKLGLFVGMKVLQYIAVGLCWDGGLTVLLFLSEFTTFSLVL